MALEINGTLATSAQIIQIRSDLQVLTLPETQVQLDGRYVRSVNGITPASGNVNLSLTSGTDFNVNSPVAGEVLKYDGTRWVNAAETGGAGSGGAGVTDGSKGDITVSGSGSLYTINPNTITLAKMATIGAGTLLGNNTISSAIPAALSASQINGMLPLANTTTKGLMPILPGGTTLFLRADGTWTNPVISSAPIDGGFSSSIYGGSSNLDGGSASSVFSAGSGVSGGSAT